MSESAFWGSVRSALRRHFRYWKPATQAKVAARRKYEGENRRQKWEYQCAHCKKWFMDKETQIDHIIPVGSLKNGDDLKGFLERLTPETGFQVLCKEDHQIKTNKERKK
jgi:5-methylcytosine-specific restriction endonuclease McrA